MFGFMHDRTDFGGYMKAIDSLLPALAIDGTLPSYLTKFYLVSTILFSPSVRGALRAVKQIESASKSAVKKRKQELEENKDEKHDMLRKMLEIRSEKGKRSHIAHCKPTTTFFRPTCSIW